MAGTGEVAVPSVPVDRDRLRRLLDEEVARHREDHPRSLARLGAARHLLTGVPMTWMASWAGGFPVGLASAHGATVTDVDGHTYVDFALGDTGAMAGHSPDAVVRAVRRRAETLGGITAMLPTDDAEWVAGELSRRFGLDQWSFALSATDANRWALRLARLVTGRPRVLVFSYCYHGTVDETFVVTGPDGTTRSRPGNVGPAVDPATTTVAVEFNDLDAVRAALASGEVAVVLTEPALTNIGIVLPGAGFLAGLRQACSETGTLLMIDETHTWSAGPGGATAAWGLEPDLLTLGKAVAGGIPMGAYGLTASLAERVLGTVRAGAADIVDVGGVGGTLAGNALSMAAARATLDEVLTDGAFATMTARADRLVAGVRDAIEVHALPWTVTQLGARAEVRFCSPAPTTGSASAAAGDAELDAFLHLYLSNRGVLITPFHNMVLTCPATTEADVDRHTLVFAGMAAALRG